MTAIHCACTLTSTTFREHDRCPSRRKVWDAECETVATARGVGHTVDQLNRATRILWHESWASRLQVLSACRQLVGRGSFSTTTVFGGRVALRATCCALLALEVLSPFTNVAPLRQGYK